MKYIFISLLAFIFTIPVKAQLIVTSGASFTSTAGTYMVMDNMGMEYYSTPNALLCTFKFTGNADANLKATWPIPFTNIELNKTNNAKLVLLDEISAGGTVQFNSGLIDLHGSILNLGGTGTLVNENETNHIIETGQVGGYVVTAYPINAPNAVNPGNIGAVITSSANLGLVTIKRGQQVLTGTGLTGSIKRDYVISTANNNALNASLSLSYFNAELNAMDENLLTQFKSTDSIAYTDMNFSVRDAAVNFVKQVNYNNLDGIYTLSSYSGGPLPVTITDFTAQCKNNFIQLSWKTQTEQNSDRFDIQRSIDGSGWQKIGSVKAAGNSSNTLLYNFADHSLNAATYFYRLAEYDADNKFIYSSILKSGCGSSSLFSVSPNPVSDIAKVMIGASTNGKGTLILYNTSGQKIMSQSIVFNTGTNQYPVNMAGLPQGNYNLLFVREHAAEQIVSIIKL
ncbi:MAG: hypothetical protein ABJA78_15060 [Ferruginibacter sp.]